MKILITGGSGFIGTNLLQEYLDRQVQCLNLDWNPPLNPSHAPYWRECDILDAEALECAFNEFDPTVVVHLAARTDTDIYELDGDMDEYIQNTQGTLNVIRCVQGRENVDRFVLASTMFVCKPGYLPSGDRDYSPFTLYGLSKKLNEDYLHEGDLTCTWTIIRPQTTWGPWCVRYRDAMFKVMRKGLYIHPNKRNVRRSYGYVGNVVWQIDQIINAPRSMVHGQMFYVGDRAINLLDWVECVSRALTGKRPIVVPASCVRLIALAGDACKKLGVSFPITSSRYRSMTENYLTPIERTFDVFGEPPVGMEQGVREIVDWYKNESDQVVNFASRKVKVELPR